MGGARLRLTRRAVLGGTAALFAVAARRRPDLEAALGLAVARASTSVVVSRHGEFVAERSAPGGGPERPRAVASGA